jgi:hypothetical protein
VKGLLEGLLFFVVFAPPALAVGLFQVLDTRSRQLRFAFGAGVLLITCCALSYNDIRLINPWFSSSGGYFLYCYLAVTTVHIPYAVIRVPALSLATLSIISVTFICIAIQMFSDGPDRRETTVEVAPGFVCRAYRWGSWLGESGYTGELYEIWWRYPGIGRVVNRNVVVDYNPEGLPPTTACNDGSVKHMESRVR